MHVSDFDPNRPGLEVFQVHERPSQFAGVEFRDASTGQLIWGKMTAGDTGRGLCADVDPRYPGAEFFARGSFDATGREIPMQGGNNFAIWWDGDLLRELLNRNTISKWNWETGQTDQVFTAEGCTST